MAHYIDGYVFPIPRERLTAYQRLAEAVADIWKEHGALDYREYVGDDTQLEGTRPFSEFVANSADEAIVFGWMEFETREARDRAHAKVATDPRMEELVNSSDTGFDVGRMVYGRFSALVPVFDTSNQ